MRRLVAIAMLAAAMLATPAQAADKLKVLASFSILGDIVKNVGGDRIEVATLVGANGDAHVYTPAPADAKKVVDARLVFVNGLGFEGWMARLVRASGSKAVVVTASTGIAPRKAADAHGHGASADPHAWQSVANVKVYVGNIRDALIKADPEGKAAYEVSANAYLSRLDALDREIRDAVARVPADRRKVISTHSAFGYFEDAYGIDFIAPLGVSTEAEASARDIARIITQIRRQKIPAIFIENVTDPRLSRRIADETGARIGGTLYSDALTEEKGPAPSYIEMMRHNIGTLSAALGS